MTDTDDTCLRRSLQMTRDANINEDAVCDRRAAAAIVVTVFCTPDPIYRYSRNLFSAFPV